jgi:hypothetical protein
MSVHRVVAGLALLGLLSLVSVLPADGPKKDSTTPNDQEVVATKATLRTPAASVDFRKELNLPFSSLGTLGSRIDAARRAHDPITLANAAHELSVSEKVARKKASLTSSAVFNDAIELAKLRRKEKELEAMVQVANQVETAQDNIALLQDQLRLAREQVKADVQAGQQDTEPGWKPRTVVLNNYTTQYLDLYVNGNYKIQVAPGMQQTVTIEHRWNPTVLTAYGNADVNTWGPRYIWGQFTKYTWNIE